MRMFVKQRMLREALKKTGNSLVFDQTGGGDPPDQTLKEKTGNLPKH